MSRVHAIRQRSDELIFMFGGAASKIEFVSACCMWREGGGAGLFPPWYPPPHNSSGQQETSSSACGEGDRIGCGDFDVQCPCTSRLYVRCVLAFLIRTADRARGRILARIHVSKMRCDVGSFMCIANGGSSAPHHDQSSISALLSLRLDYVDGRLRV